MVLVKSGNPFSKDTLEGMGYKAGREMINGLLPKQEDVFIRGSVELAGPHNRNPGSPLFSMCTLPLIVLRGGMSISHLLTGISGSPSSASATSSYS